MSAQNDFERLYFDYRLKMFLLAKSILHNDHDAEDANAQKDIVLADIEAAIALLEGIDEAKEACITGLNEKAGDNPSDEVKAIIEEASQYRRNSGIRRKRNIYAR